MRRWRHQAPFVTQPIATFFTEGSAGGCYGDFSSTSRRVSAVRPSIWSKNISEGFFLMKLRFGLFFGRAHAGKDRFSWFVNSNQRLAAHYEKG